MDKRITTSRKELIKAYEIWNKKFKDNPERFVDEKDVKAKEQADYLIEMIKEARK